MRKVILGIGGIANLIFTAFHVLMFFGIANSTELIPRAKEALFMFNLAVTLMIAFFAYVSLCCMRQLLETHLGKAALVLIALVYLSRASMEIILGSWEWLFLGSCGILGMLYLLLLIPLGEQGSIEPAADLNAVP